MTIMFSIIRYIQIIFPSFPCPNKTNFNYFFIINKLDLLSKSFGSAELWKLNHRSVLGQHSRGSAASKCSILVKKKTGIKCLKCSWSNGRKSWARHEIWNTKILGNYWVYTEFLVLSQFLCETSKLGCPEEIPIFSSQLKIDGWDSPTWNLQLSKRKNIYQVAEAKVKTRP